MKHSRISGNFTFHEAPRHALGEWSDALAQMLAQPLDGLIVRGVFDPAAMAKVAARLDQAPMPRVNFDKLGSHALGYAIVGRTPTSSSTSTTAMHSGSEFETSLPTWVTSRARSALS
jgi:hypothetical protein